MLRSGAAVGATVTWDTLPGKPSAFAPAAHTHAWGDITGKPTTFPPSTHTHLWADIGDKPTIFPPSAHTHAWPDITGKPVTFAPSAHTHLWADITDRPTIPTATPLSSAAPKALGTVSPGAATEASRADHVHPLPSGRLEFIGNVTVSSTVLVALSSGMRRAVLGLAGVTTADRLVFAAIAPCSAGCEAMNVYATAANQVTLSYSTPALAIGAVIEIPVAVYRIV